MFEFMKENARQPNKIRIALNYYRIIQSGPSKTKWSSNKLKPDLFGLKDCGFGGEHKASVDS